MNTFRRTARHMALILVLTVALAGAGAAQAQEITWRMATIAPENSPLFRIYARYFTERVHEWSQGRLRIEPLPVGEMAHPFKLYEAVADGRVDMAWAHPGFLTLDDPTNALFAGFPGSMTPETFMHWAYMGGGQRLWQEYRRKKQGLMTFYMGQTTPDIFANSHRPVRVAADLRGYHQVTTGPWAQILEKTFGGVATVIPSGDILEQLKRLAVDGVEYGGAGANLALGFHRVARYVILPGVHQPGAATELIMRADVYDELPPDLKQILRDATRATTFHVWLTLGHGDIEAMATYQRFGNVLTVMEDTLQAAIRQAGRAWMAKRMAAVLDRGDKLAYKVYQSYAAYQANRIATNDLRLWPRVTPP